MSSKKRKNAQYVKPNPPENDEQLIKQIVMARRFLFIAEDAVKGKRHETAYIMTDRANELLDQIQKAMEDLEPT